jgi:hypothetical protein
LFVVVWTAGPVMARPASKSPTATLVEDRRRDNDAGRRPFAAASTGRPTLQQQMILLKCQNGSIATDEARAKFRRYPLQSERDVSRQNVIRPHEPKGNMRSGSTFPFDAVISD